MCLTVESFRSELILCLAHTEAVIDFGDDDREDVSEKSIFEGIIPKVQSLRNELTYVLSQGRKGELVREGLRVVLVGPPNAGTTSHSDDRYKFDTLCLINFYNDHPQVNPRY